MAARPNIVYIHSHDTGRYVQPYGYATDTPHLQRFAEQGVLFRKAFCANPTCSPSRASLLTGQWPHSAGMMGLAHRGFQVKDMKQHLIHTLKPAGYHTALCGVQHVAKKRDTIGYDELLKPANHHAEHVGPTAAAFVRDVPKDKPFFLSVGFYETHREFPEPDENHDPRYTLPPTPLPDTPETRRDMAGYNTMARKLDTGIGEVLSAIDEAGLRENTLVIVTTDHGPAFPHMKCNLTDHGIGVMLMMRGPGGFTGGKVVDAMVSQIDIFPTLCELADIAPPPWLQGTSILPVVRGEKDRIRDELFAEVNFHAAYEPMRAVRTERYKYIRRMAAREIPVLPNCDESESKTLHLKHGLAERKLPREELYDLMFDPGEANNLADDPEMASTQEEMRRRLDRWMRETDDPILAGPLTIPADTEINLVDQPSPDDPTEHVATARPAE